MRLQKRRHQSPERRRSLLAPASHPLRVEPLTRHVHPPRHTTTRDPRTSKNLSKARHGHIHDASLEVRAHTVSLTVGKDDLPAGMLLRPPAGGGVAGRDRQQRLDQRPLVVPGVGGVAAPARQRGSPPARDGRARRLRVGEVGDHVERRLDRVELGVQVLDPPALGLQGGVRGDGAGDEPADLGEFAADDSDLVSLELVGVGTGLVAVLQGPIRGGQLRSVMMSRRQARSERVWLGDSSLDLTSWGKIRPAGRASDSTKRTVSACRWAAGDLHSEAWGAVTRLAGVGPARCRPRPCRDRVSIQFRPRGPGRRSRARCRVRRLRAGGPACWGRPGRPRGRTRGQTIYRPDRGRQPKALPGLRRGASSTK